MGVLFENQVNALALTYLRKYHEELRKQRTENMGYTSIGCTQRAYRLLEDLQNIGINSIVITITGDLLTHQSDGLFNGQFRFHNVVLDDRLAVYDPNYTGAVAIPFAEYVQTAYLYPKSVHIWREGDYSAPIARFDGQLVLEQPPFP